MSDISNIGNSIYPVYSYSRDVSVRPAQAPQDQHRPNDVSGAVRADLARFRNAISRGVDLSSLSIARARAIRAEIENGTYETQARLDGTVDRLLDVIA